MNRRHQRNIDNMSEDETPLIWETETGEEVVTDALELFMETRLGDDYTKLDPERRALRWWAEQTMNLYANAFTAEGLNKFVRALRAEFDPVVERAIERFDAPPEC